MSKTARRKKPPRVRNALGLPCPDCGTATAVKFTRRRDDGTFRFRLCPSCKRTLGTLERPVGGKSYTPVPTPYTPVLPGRIVPDIIPPRPAPGV